MDRNINNNGKDVAITKTAETSGLPPGGAIKDNINLKEGTLAAEKQMISHIDLNLLDSFANPVHVIGIDKEIKFVNKALENITRFSASEIIGMKPPYPWWPEETARSYSARLSWAMRRGGSQYDHLFHDRDGKNFWVAIHLTPIVHLGALSGYIANWVDVTSQQKKNQKITTELYQNEKKLRHNLQTEIDQRGKYFRLLVHELKTPMTATLFSSQMLCDQLTNETQLKLAKNINRAVLSLNGRIDELMDLAKGEMGMIEMHFVEVNMREILSQIADDFDSITRHQGKVFNMDWPARIPTIRGDQGRLRQILQNLLNNAVKFTGEGAVITLRVKVLKDNLIIEVQDTGPGISKYEQRLIFTPYCNVKKNKESYSGLGLGLSLCKVLVELHGGHISVQSEVGKGAKFTCSFPLGQASKQTGEGTNSRKL